MYRNVEVQIGQIANSIKNQNQGELPSKTEMSPKEHVKTITLRSDKQLEDPPVLENKVNEESDKGGDEQLEKEVIVGEGSKEKLEEKQSISSTTIPIPPTVLFSQ